MRPNGHTSAAAADLDEQTVKTDAQLRQLGKSAVHAGLGGFLGCPNVEINMCAIIYVRFAN